jgi:hypothetical protein
LLGSVRLARIQCGSVALKKQFEMDVCLLSRWLDCDRLCPDLFIATLQRYFEEKRIVCAKANYRRR